MTHCPQLKRNKKSSVLHISNLIKSVLRGPASLYLKSTALVWSSVMLFDVAAVRHSQNPML